MRILLLVLVFLPCAANAQINRSANELARERIKDYVRTRLFKDAAYQSVSYSDLKEQNIPRSDIAWSISHRFEIIDSQFVADKRIEVRKPHRFSFYLDKKLNVISAESYALE